MLLEDSATNTSSMQSSTKLSICGAGEAQVLPKDTKVSHDDIVAQDFIQEVSSELIDEDDIQIIDRNQELTADVTIEVELAQVLKGRTLHRRNKKRFHVAIHMGKSSKKAFKKLLPKIMFQIRRQDNNYSRI